jgi:hypothetical protein
MEDFKMLKKGSVITVKHIQSGRGITYLIIEDKIHNMFRLVNLTSNNLMTNFETANPENARNYIEKVLKCIIVKVSE